MAGKQGRRSETDQDGPDPVHRSDAHSMSRNSPDLEWKLSGRNSAKRLLASFYENGMAVIENRTVAVDKSFSCLYQKHRRNI